MQRSDFRFFERLRVRWAEIDAQQIVFNGHYLIYFDTAVAGYWRALAMPYAATMQSLGGDMFVRKATLEYLGSAVYDDVLDIGMRCARVGNSSMSFVAGAFRQDALLVSGELIYVFADPAAKASLPVPPRAARAVRELRGRRVDGRRARRLAGASSRPPPGRSAPRCSSASRRSRPRWNGTTPMPTRSMRSPSTGSAAPSAPGGCSSTFPASPRSAGWRSRRRRGTAASAAPCSRRCSTRRAARGDREAVLHAQLGAAPFYERAGFVRRGPEFDEAGIAHVEMLRVL